MRNEIIEKNETVIMKGAGTTMTNSYRGMYARLIAPFSSQFAGVIDGKRIVFQTWEILLSTGEKTLARMITTWLD